MAELWGWRTSSLSQVNWTTALQNTRATMLSLNYILLRQSSRPFLGRLLRHRAKCDLEIHRLRAPLTPVRHFQLFELCMTFKKCSLSIASKSLIFIVLLLGAHKKVLYAPQTVIQQEKSKSWNGFESSTCLKNSETFDICCNFSILKENNIGNMRHWHSELMMEKAVP